LIDQKTKTGTHLFIETGGRLHLAIREDARMNLAAIDSFSPQAQAQYIETDSSPGDQ